MPRIVMIASHVVGALLASATQALAQPPSMPEQWSFDPEVLIAESEDLLLRAPDATIDGLFQAVHASAKSPNDAGVLCQLFDPHTDRSLEGLNAIASRLGNDSRVRFADAVARIFIAAAQHPRQPYDAATARQALKSAGVRAALLDDGFVAGLNGPNHPARCRSIGLLLDALQTRPPPERAAVTRLLLSEGLTRLVFPDGSVPIR
jgi:hypothetical protein